MKTGELTPERAKADYAHFLKDTGVAVRRYAGAGHTDYPVRARVTGYAPSDLAGAIVQGDRRAIILAADLDAAGFVAPVLISDKLVVRGRELAILAADDSSRRVNGQLIAYEIQARG